MSLMKCPECGERVSSYAANCPHCGYGISNDTKSKNEVMNDEDRYQLNCPQVAQYHYPVSQKIHNNTKKKKSNRDVWVASVILCAIVLFFVIVINNSIKLTQKYLDEIYVDSDIQQIESTNPTATIYISYSGSSSTTTSTTAGTKTSGSTVYDDDLEWSLINYAMKKVKNHLLSPSTAEFPSYTECDIKKGTDNVYSIVGYVDATNAYGAVVRTTWGAMIQYDGTYSSVVMIQIGDDYYFD